MLREAVEARDPVFVILEGLEAQRIAELVRRLDAAALVQRNEMPVELVALDATLVLLLEQVVVELVGGR